MAYDRRIGLGALDAEGLQIFLRRLQTAANGDRNARCRAGRREIDEYRIENSGWDCTCNMSLPAQSEGLCHLHLPFGALT